MQIICYDMDEIKIIKQIIKHASANSIPGPIL
jgi:hypothetical protein